MLNAHVRARPFAIFLIARETHAERSDGAIVATDLAPSCGARWDQLHEFFFEWFFKVFICFLERTRFMSVDKPNLYEVTL